MTVIDVRRAVRALLDQGPRFAQLVTVDGSGAPVTRTVGAEVGPDWTVELLTRREHARLKQLAANPLMQLLFVAEPLTTEPPAHPAVIDYGLPVPRLVALSGVAEPMDADATRRSYRRQSEAALARGCHRAPHRTPDQVDADLVGLRVRVHRVRAEGFGGERLAETWDPRVPVGFATTEEGTA